MGWDLDGTAGMLDCMLEEIYTDRSRLKIGLFASNYLN